MANLRIQFDKSAYRPNEIVRGHVVIDSDKSTSCDKLALTIFWRTHGRGDRKQGDKQQIQIAQSEQWVAGGHYQYPFEFRLPASPPSYEGKYLNIEWTVELEADFDGKSLGSRIRSFFGADLRETFIVTNEGAHLHVADDLTQDAVSGAVSGMGVLFALIFGGAFAGAGLLLLTFGLFGQQMPAIVFGAVLLLIGSGVLFFLVLGAMFGRFVHQVELTNVRHDIDAGTLHCDIEIVPKRSVQVQSASATLTVRERTINTSGTSNSTYRHTIYEERWEQAGSSSISPPSILTLSPTFQVPRNLPPSFGVRNNYIEWSINTRIQLNRGVAKSFNLQLHATIDEHLKSPPDEWGM